MFRHRLAAPIIAILCSTSHDGATLSSASAQVTQDCTITQVRLAVVNTPDTVLSTLIPEFQAETCYTVTMTSTDAPYTLARNGLADLVISHLGHSQIEQYMADGLGLWPRPVFANKAAMFGPNADPAGVLNLSDAVAAFQEIAATHTPFVVNNAATERYLSQVLWNDAGRPDRTGWWIDNGLRDQAAFEYAISVHGYVLWGLVPGLRYALANPTVDVAALNSSDALYDRGMVSVKVDPTRTPGINGPGAAAFESFLVRQDVEAKIRDFRGLGYTNQMWVPLGRNNSGEFLSGNGDQFGDPCTGTADTQGSCAIGLVCHNFPALGGQFCTARCVSTSCPVNPNLKCNFMGQCMLH